MLCRQKRRILRSKIKYTNLCNFDEIKHGFVTILAHNKEFKLIFPYHQVQEPLVAVTKTGLQRMTLGKNVFTKTRAEEGSPLEDYYQRQHISMQSFRTLKWQELDNLTRIRPSSILQSVSLQVSKPWRALAGKWCSEIGESTVLTSSQVRNNDTAQDVLQLSTGERMW